MLQRPKALASVIVQSRLVRQGMMNNREDLQSIAVSPDRPGQAAHGETVDEHATASGDRFQRIRQARSRLTVRVGKPPLELVDHHTPSPLTKSGNHARIVDVAAGPLAEGAGYDNVKVVGVHTGPS